MCVSRCCFELTVVLFLLIRCVTEMGQYVSDKLCSCSMGRENVTKNAVKAVGSTAESEKQTDRVQHL